MPSVREQVIQKLFSNLEDHLLASVMRDELYAKRISAEGAVVLKEGDMEDPDEVLGGFQNDYMRFEIELEIYIQKRDAAQRHELFDDLCLAIEGVLLDDERLGGLVAGMEWMGVRVDNEAVEGGEDIKAGIIPVYIEYAARSPLG